jgi:hypothetical protein
MRHLYLPWYLPSFYGDIKLESRGPELTSLAFESLTPTEAEAMRKLRRRALGGWGRKPWCAAEKFPDKLDYESVGEIVLCASIEDVHAVVAQALRPGRDLVTAIKFSDGSMEEKKEGQTIGAYRDKPRKPAEKDETRALAKKEEKPEGKSEKKPEKKAEAAVTVAAPDRGCPLPKFVEAELRAERVLSVFLTEDQRQDFNESQQFLVTGADTGHRYLVTSRHAPRALAKVSGWTLYDVDEQRPLCVHDWNVPAPEEMLAITCCLQLPGREHHLRLLPEHA